MVSDHSAGTYNTRQVIHPPVLWNSGSGRVGEQRHAARLEEKQTDDDRCSIPARGPSLFRLWRSLFVAPGRASRFIHSPSRIWSRFSFSAQKSEGKLKHPSENLTHSSALTILRGGIVPEQTPRDMGQWSWKGASSTRRVSPLLPVLDSWSQFCLFFIVTSRISVMIHQDAPSPWTDRSTISFPCGDGWTRLWGRGGTQVRFLACKITTEQWLDGAVLLSFITSAVAFGFLAVQEECSCLGRWATQEL